jgi:hypothetical protein
MATTIPIPTRGQPVDAAFLSQLASAVNEILRNIDLRKGKTYVKATNTQSVVATTATANTSFFATTELVKIDSPEVSTSTKGSAQIKFSPIAFSGPPVVTATPVIIGSVTDAATTAIVTISDVNQAGCTVNVRFATPGTVKDLYVQVIAVGNSS